MVSIFMKSASEDEEGDGQHAPDTGEAGGIGDEAESGSEPFIDTSSRKKDATLMTEIPDTRPWDITESLDSDERIAAYLDAVLEDGDPVLILAALGDITHALRSADRRNGDG